MVLAIHGIELRDLRLFILDRYLVGRFIGTLLQCAEGLFETCTALYIASANSRDNMLRFVLPSTQSPCAQPQFGDKRAHALGYMQRHGWDWLPLISFGDERRQSAALLYHFVLLPHIVIQTESLT